MLCFCKNIMKKTNINNMEFVRCPNCGYLKKTSILKPEEEKKRYDCHICDNSYIDYMKKVYDSIKAYILDGVSLDYGCGQIHALADILNSDNKDCDYYDLYYFNNLINRKYNNIILIEVFEHVENIYSLMVRLKSMLEPKGRIIIMTKCIPTNVNNWWYLRDATHISFVENKTMELLASMIGLNLVIDDDKSLFIFSSIE